MYERLPQELKAHAGFCGWKYELRDGRKTKVPKTVTGRNAHSNDPGDFCTFEEIMKNAIRFDGLGILVTGDLAAIDIDNCIAHGKLSEMAAVIVEKARSYTEVTPSGRGLRILGRVSGFIYDRKRYYVNNHELGLEVYTEGEKKHTVSVTGNVFNDLPMRDISDVLPEILEMYMRKPEPQRAEGHVDAPGSFLTDEEVVQKAASAANGEKFAGLYDGDISGYPSQSEADLAFMTMLAFWCGGDGEQMDRIFRGSGLYREKWERADYRESTINRAVNGTADFYMPPEISSVDEDFNAMDDGRMAHEDPIPLDAMTVPAFPVDALPEDIREYVLAVAESTQTPVDVAACASLSVLSIGMQGKYVVRPKPDWTEPVNTFIAVFMPPSERKSAVCSAMGKPMNEYEKEWNREHAAEIDFSKSQKSILERRLKALEDQAAKGKAEMEDVRRASEGGIFDLLKGMYTRYVNIDVFLKGYSGDPIRVDRIGRESQVIYDPVLTVMLMAQPSVLAGVMENGNFRGRGLTARFLYCVPESHVGTRKYRSEPVPEETYRRYERCIRDILADEPDMQPEVITLSPEADRMLPAERSPRRECSSLVFRRISTRCLSLPSDMMHGQISMMTSPVISGKAMADATRIGRYFIEHARAAFSLLGADEGIQNCKYVLEAIQRAGLTEVSRRDIMRLCRAFKTAEEVQPVIDQLADYGYLSEKKSERQPGRGRNPLPVYLVNTGALDRK